VPFNIAEAAARSPANVTPAVIVAILYSSWRAGRRHLQRVRDQRDPVGGADPGHRDAVPRPGGRRRPRAVFLAEPVGLPQVIGGAGHRARRLADATAVDPAADGPRPAPSSAWSRTRLEGP
jgi:hypothetical protein